MQIFGEAEVSYSTKQIRIFHIKQIQQDQKEDGGKSFFLTGLYSFIGIKLNGRLVYVKTTY